MESVLLLGGGEPVVTGLLTRLGYQVISAGGEEERGVVDAVHSTVVDLILLNEALATTELTALCEFFRRSPATRSVPIVCRSNRPLEVRAVTDLLGNIEVLPQQASAGSIISSIATQLRLRKMDAREGRATDLASLNLALRDHNDRLARERAEAKEVQESLLPRTLPQDHRCEIAVSYEPVEDVGGDWYDVVLTERESVEFSVADVTGHGIAAAFIGAMTKLALSVTDHSSPGITLTGLNRTLAPQLPEGRFITMAMGELSLRDGILKIGRAGHPPPVVARCDGTVEVLSATGFPFGFIEDATYEEQSVKLSPGDMVLLYTDGLTEAMNRDNEQFGEQRLMAACREGVATGSAAGFLSTVRRHGELFCDGRLLKDDITFVAVRYLGSTSRE